MSAKYKPRIITYCLWCGKELHTLKSHIKRGQGQYCGRSCKMLHYHANMGHGTYTLHCPICGTKKTIRKSHKNREFTCGKKECASEYRWQTFLAETEQRIGESLEDALQRLYITERKSFREIHNILGINGRTIAKALHKFDIPVRHGSEAVKTQWENNNERRETQAETMRQQFAHQKGRRHPCWRGGNGNTTNPHYTNQQWRRLCKRIRNRDNNKCTRCGMFNAEHIKCFGCSLTVHHIIPRILSKNDAPSNLTTLCIPCHRAADTEFLWLL